MKGRGTTPRFRKSRETGNEERNIWKKNVERERETECGIRCVNVRDPPPLAATSLVPPLSSAHSTSACDLATASTSYCQPLSLSGKRKAQAITCFLCREAQWHVGKGLHQILQFPPQWPWRDKA